MYDAIAKEAPDMLVYLISSDKAETKYTVRTVSDRSLGAFYLYDATAHALQRVAACDLRRVTGYQDFVDDAPLDLVFVADHARMHMVPASQRESYAAVAAGAIAQNVYLFAAGNGLATVLRAWIDRTAIADALGLTHDQQVLLSQTVGHCKTS